MTTAEIIDALRQLGNRANIAGQERFGIRTPKSFGVRTPALKQFAREVKKKVANRHATALELWETGIYDARAVAFMIVRSRCPETALPGDRALPDARASDTLCSFVVKNHK